MEIICGSLRVERSEKNIEISNGQVMVRLFYTDGGYGQEFYACDNKDRYRLILSSLHKNLILSSQHRTCASPMISGERLHLFPVCRESLRMTYSSAQIIRHDEQKVIIRLAGSTHGHCLECDISLEHCSNAIYTVISDDLMHNGRAPLIEYLMSSFAFIPDGRMLANAGDADYVWAPNLRPANDHVIGDNAFHSPALIIQKGKLSAALVPDIGLLEENRAMPAALDLDFDNGMLFSPLLSYGFCGYERSACGHYFSHDMTMARRLEATRLTYSYHILLDANTSKKSICKNVSSFLWSTYGAHSITHKNAIPAQTQQGRNLSHSALSSSPAILITDSQAAMGLYIDAVKNGNSQQIHAAKSLVDIITAAPQQNGLFATKFSIDRGQWAGCKNSITDGYYHSVECSSQLYWLLKWHQHVENDPIIIRKARNYADFLIESRLKTGAIPSWYSIDHLPLSALRSSAQTAMSVLFIAELANITGFSKYLKAAEKSAQFVIKEVIGRGLFHDYTLIDRDTKSTTDCMDPHTGILPQSALAMLWVGQMCASMYNITGLKLYLESGLEVMNKLCLMQTLKHNNSPSMLDTFGLCASDNIGSRQDLELSAEFGRCVVEFGRLTGDRQYIERGASALKAASEHQNEATMQNARLSATKSVISAELGSAYINVAQKWGIALFDAHIQQLKFGRGCISIDIAQSESGNCPGKIVFGEVRGKSYRIRINGTDMIFSQADMLSGIQIPFVNQPRTDELPAISAMSESENLLVTLRQELLQESSF